VENDTSALSTPTYLLDENLIMSRGAAKDKSKAKISGDRSPTRRGTHRSTSNSSGGSKGSETSLNSGHSWDGIQRPINITVFKQGDESDPGMKVTGCRSSRAFWPSF
jgi:hypothetical protein